LGSDWAPVWAPKKPFVPIRTIGKYISLYSAILCMATNAKPVEKTAGRWAEMRALVGMVIECPECRARFHVEDVIVSQWESTNLQYDFSCPRCGSIFSWMEGYRK